MLYLDYAKPLAGGGYILSFFADSVEDLESISHGQKFVTKNGTDYGVPQAGSTVIVTSPNSGKTTYVMDAEGVWVVTEDISYSAVVANPSDAATAKLEKLKVNDTTYANWTENEIKALAGKGEDGVSVTSFETVSSTVVGDNTNTTVRAHFSNNTSDEFVIAAKNGTTPTVTINPFINGRIYGEVDKTIDTRNVKNKIYFLQCFDRTGNLQNFTVNGVKSVEGKFAMVIFGKDYLNSLAIVQTDSIIVTGLAKTTWDVNGFKPSKGNQLVWYEIDGAPFVRNEVKT